MTDQSEAGADHTVEQLKKVGEQGYARVDDDRGDKWLSVVYEGNVGHILCTTIHSNGIADGEEIRIGLAHEFVQEDGLVFEEPPEKVKQEVSRLERI